MGATIGGWTTTSAHTGGDPARGLRLSGFVDCASGRNSRLRLEAAFVQAGFLRDFPAQPNRHVTENSLEFGVHAFSHPISGTSLRVFAGPLLTAGLGCGTDGSNASGGRVPCGELGLDDGGSVRIGGVVGVHGAWSRTRQITLDLHAQGNTVAAARGRGAMIAMSVGVRLPR